MLNEIEIDIDTWPMISTYVEIEGKNEEEVLEAIDLLGLSREKLTTLDVQRIYEYYGYDLEEIKDLSFKEENE